MFTTYHDKHSKVYRDMLMKLNNNCYKLHELDATDGDAFIEKRVKVFQTLETRYTITYPFIPYGFTMPLGIISIIENKNLKTIDGNVEYVLNIGDDMIFAIEPMIHVDWQITFTKYSDDDNDTYVTISRAYVKDVAYLITESLDGVTYVHGVIAHKDPVNMIRDMNNKHNTYAIAGVLTAAVVVATTIKIFK